jgi:hypothetical protein
MLTKKNNNYKTNKLIGAFLFLYINCAYLFSSFKIVKTFRLRISEIFIYLKNESNLLLLNSNLRI